MSEHNWQWHVARAANHLELGQKEIWLDRGDLKEYPWEFCNRVEEGCSVRMSLRTSWTFYADHPTGLKFRWFVDIEPHKANGHGYFMIDTDTIKAVASMLPKAACSTFRGLLLAAAKVVQEKSDEWRAMVTQQDSAAASLRTVASSL